MKVRSAAISARKNCIQFLHRSYEFLLNSIIRPEDVFLSCPTFSQVAGRVFVPLGIKGQSWNPDPARDHSYWVLPRPNDLCYAGPIGRSAASPEICFAASEPGAALHQSKASREFEPDNILRLQNGQGPGAP